MLPINRLKQSESEVLNCDSVYMNVRRFAISDYYTNHEERMTIVNTSQYILQFLYCERYFDEFIFSCSEICVKDYHCSIE